MVLILRVAALVEISVRGSVDFRFGKDATGTVCVHSSKEKVSRPDSKDLQSGGVSANSPVSCPNPAQISEWLVFQQVTNSLKTVLYVYLANNAQAQRK
jgi:hypothetical protein